MLGSLIHTFDWKVEGGFKPKDIYFEETFGLPYKRLNPYELFLLWCKNFMYSPSPPSIQTSLLWLVTIIAHPSKGLKFNFIVVKESNIYSIKV